MRIGELGERTAVATKTIRYWEGEGLLPEPERTAAGYRDYEASTVDRIGFIRRSQTAGLTLTQIRQILDIADRGTPPCRHVAAAVDDRLTEVDGRIRELEEMRRHLRSLAERAARQDPDDCSGYCSIIAAE